MLVGDGATRLAVVSDGEVNAGLLDLHRQLCSAAGAPEITVR